MTYSHESRSVGPTRAPAPNADQGHRQASNKRPALDSSAGFFMDLSLTYRKQRLFSSSLQCPQLRLQIVRRLARTPHSETVGAFY